MIICEKQQGIVPISIKMMEEEGFFSDDDDHQLRPQAQHQHDERALVSTAPQEVVPLSPHHYFSPPSRTSAEDVDALFEEW